MIAVCSWKMTLLVLNIQLRLLSGFLKRSNIASNPSKTTHMFTASITPKIVCTPNTHSMEAPNALGICHRCGRRCC